MVFRPVPIRVTMDRRWSGLKDRWPDTIASVVLQSDALDVPPLRLGQTVCFRVVEVVHEPFVEREQE